MASRPQALSSRSSSFSSAGSSESKPCAHDHVAGGAGAGLLAGVLDLDVVVEQHVADRLAARGLDLGACGQSVACGSTLSFGIRGFRSCLPARRAADALVHAARANSSVARLSASTACLMARWSVPRQHGLRGARSPLRSPCVLGPSAGRRPRAGPTASPPAGAAPSTRYSDSARACTSSLACSKESRSMRSMSASARP